MDKNGENGINGGKYENTTLYTFQDKNGENGINGEKAPMQSLYLLRIDNRVKKP